MYVSRLNQDVHVLGVPTRAYQLDRLIHPEIL